MQNLIQLKDDSSPAEGLEPVLIETGHASTIKQSKLLTVLSDYLTQRSLQEPKRT